MRSLSAIVSAEKRIVRSKGSDESRGRWDAREVEIGGRHVGGYLIKIGFVLASHDQYIGYSLCI